ncbi:hypothetical protein B0H11DRAFT_2261406 [Mycena galericulata]|nr:hypothetical protein B0H11DRAFT_2261406 [Mycena galericulata]
MDTTITTSPRWSPRAKMPREMLIRIFLFFTRWSALDVSLFADLRMLLCLVCREWRDVVYGYALLWTSLPVTLATRPDFLEDLLGTRTQLADINLFLHMDPSMRILGRAPDRVRVFQPRTMRTFFEIVFPIVQRHLRRVTRLTIYCPSRAIWSLIGSQITDNSKSFVTLMRLSVALYCEPGWNSTAHDIRSTPEDVPVPALEALRELRLRSTTPLSGEEATFRTLTVLRFVRYRKGLARPWREIAQVLGMTTALEVLEMNELECTRIEGLTVSLENLTTLELTYSDPATLDAVCLLRMPKLVSLNLQTLSTIDLFLDRCRHLLETLQHFALWVNVARLTLQQTTLLFGRAQHLQSLDMHAVHPIVFAHILTLLDSGELALPHLQRLLVAYPVTRSEASQIVVPRVPARVGHPFTLIADGVGFSQQAIDYVYFELYGENKLLSLWYPSGLLLQNFMSSSLTAVASESPVDFTLLLPTEILVEIFSVRIQRSKDTWHWRVYWRWVIAAVCKRWYSVVYGTRTFWHPVVIRRCMRRSFVSFSLKRVETGPLTILVNAILEETEYFGSVRGTLRREVGQVSLAKFARRCLAPLQQVFPRVHAITIECSRYRCWLNVMSTLANFEANDLAVFHSNVHTAFGQGHPTVHPLFFQGTPAIQRMYFNGVVPLWWLYPHTLTSLTHLEIHGYPFNMAMTWSLLGPALTAAPVLGTLELSYVACTDTDAASPVTLNALHELRLSYSHRNEVAMVQNMVMPALCSLHVRLNSLESSSDYEGETNRALYDMNPDMFHRAKHVKIAMRSVAMGDMEHIVAAMSSATVMDFAWSGHYMIQVFMDLLQRPGFRLPLLQRLELGSRVTEMEADRLLGPWFAPNCVLVSQSGWIDDTMWTSWRIWRRLEGGLTWEEDAPPETTDTDEEVWVNGDEDSEAE